MVLHFAAELMSLIVCDQDVTLSQYNPSDDELEAIEERILERVRDSLEYQKSEVSLDGIWDIVEDCLEDSSQTYYYTHLGHEWELQHGRLKSKVRWLNPKRNEPGQGRYALNPRKLDDGMEVCDAIASFATNRPMTLDKAMIWAGDIDQSFLDFYSIPAPDTVPNPAVEQAPESK